MFSTRMDLALLLLDFAQTGLLMPIQSFAHLGRNPSSQSFERMGSGTESPWSMFVWYNQYSDNIGLAWPISGFLTKKFGSEDSCSLSKAFLCSSCALHTLTCCFLLEGLQPFFPVEFLSVVHDLGKDEPLASFLSRKEAPKKRTG